MAGKGPAPTPTEILKARGSWRAKEREGEPRPENKAPTCPAVLKGEARAEWRRQAKHLARLGIAAEMDRGVLATYCEAWGEFVAMLKRIQELTAADFEKGWERASYAGLVNAKNKAAERLVRIAQQFGFSPAARTRVQAHGKEQGGDDEARFFGNAI